ncbi:glutaredoxin family protein [Virgibacillus kekensis]|uniref:Glutaredoxin family protein n=1 Tax=Virgibacillus kekensis TaxID=202261 RepID=A0ABV9DNY5_9BACI
MSNKNVVVYISANCAHCDKLINDLDLFGINYETKNVTEYPEYMKELQARGVYGTPATLIEEKDEIISGLQTSKIKHMLGLTNIYRSYHQSLS